MNVRHEDIDEENENINLKKQLDESNRSDSFAIQVMARLKLYAK